MDWLNLCDKFGALPLPVSGHRPHQAAGSLCKFVRVSDVDLSTWYEDHSVSSFNQWQSVEMMDEEIEAVPQKGSSSANGATGMDWLMPEGRQGMIATSMAEVVKQSLASPGFHTQL